MNEKGDLTLMDGAKRSGQKYRGYSWIIECGKRTAATKSHRSTIADICIAPPAPPFVICISDSGQKHLLYRAVVNASRDLVTVTLEGEAVTYRPFNLIARLEVCKRVAAATGKPAMKEPMSQQSQMRIVEHFDSTEVLAAWLDCDSEPLTRLAVWLCPPKAECEIEYPAITGGNANDQHGATQAAFSWSD